MLGETIIGAEIENSRRKERVKAMVGIDGIQSALNRIIVKLQEIEPCSVPVTSQNRQEFFDKMGVIKSELISNGMLIEEYMTVLQSIWDDYDKSTSFRMN